MLLKMEHSVPGRSTGESRPLPAPPIRHLRTPLHDPDAMRLKAGSALVCAVTAGTLVGIFGGSLWSSERPGWRGLIFRQMDGLTRLDPVRVLPRAELAVSAL